MSSKVLVIYSTVKLEWSNYYDWNKTDKCLAAWMILDPDKSLHTTPRVALVKEKKKS